MLLIVNVFLQGVIDTPSRWGYLVLVGQSRFLTLSSHDTALNLVRVDGQAALHSSLEGGEGIATTRRGVVAPEAPRNARQRATGIDLVNLRVVIVGGQWTGDSFLLVDIATIFRGTCAYLADELPYY
jgi:hypothetical protein